MIIIGISREFMLRLLQKGHKSNSGFAQNRLGSLERSMVYVSRKLYRNGSCFAASWAGLSWFPVWEEGSSNSLTNGRHLMLRRIQSWAEKSDLA